LKPRTQYLGPHPHDDTGEYTDVMDYSVGSRVRVRLSNGKVVEAEIIAITNQSTGRKLQIVYDNVTASINPAQITEVLSTT
jgi:trans-2-enoyl-CoA reductase